MRSGFKRALMIVLLLLILVVSLAYAEEKKYPPYPDVWGYELPVYGTSRPVTHVAKMPDGDYIISYIREVKGKLPEVTFKYAWISFFSHISKDFTESEYDEFLKKIQKENRKVKYELKPKITFSDGISIEYKSDSGNCADPFDRFLQKKDKNGKVITEKMLLYLYDKPIKTDINDKCERNWDYKKNYYFKKVEHMNIPYLISLEDDTFLILSYGSNSIVALRFDKDLKTKSDLMGKNVFLIDCNTLINLRSKIKDSSDSGTSDALSKYLLKLKKED